MTRRRKGEGPAPLPLHIRTAMIHDFARLPARDKFLEFKRLPPEVLSQMMRDWSAWAHEGQLAARRKWRRRSGRRW